MSLTTREWLTKNYQKYPNYNDLVLKCMKETKANRNNIVMKLKDLADSGMKVPRPERITTYKTGVQDTPSTEISLRNRVSQLENTIRLLKGESGQIQNDLIEIKNIIPKIEPIKPINFTSDSKIKVSSPTTAVLLLSDWHIGEVVYGNQTYSTNDFNYSVAKKRATFLSQKFLEWVYLHRSNYTVDELVIVVLGDLISGELHYELTSSNEFTVPRQVVKASQLLAFVATSLAPHFKKVRIEMNCVDNHSRLTKKLQFKNAAENSYNLIIGEMTKYQMEKFNNINMTLYNDIKTLIEIQNHKYLIGHGSHFCKAWMGVPYYGIKRMIGEEAKFRMIVEGLGFHKILMGHYHVPADLVDTIMNGSLSGTSEFDIGCGRFSPPCQVGFFVHPKIGDFDFSTFWLNV